MPEDIFEVADPQAMTLAAREIPFPAGILDRWLPSAQRRDHRYRFFRRDRALRRAAPFRGWDTPAVPIERGAAEEITGRMLPVSVILWLLEEESQLLDAARAAGDADAALDAYANDVREVVRRILQRVMLAQGEAVAHGRVTIGTEAAPENQLQLGTVEFGIPAGHYFTAGGLFNDPTADILGQFTEWQQTYRATTGNEVTPGVMVASTAIANRLAANEGFTNAYATAFGRPPSVGVAEINELLARRQLPRLIIDDTAVPNHAGVMTRQIPADRLVLLPEDPANGGRAIGQTQWGLTEEQKKLERAEVFDAGTSPGLVVVPMESENPVRTGTLGTGIVMPVVTEPDLVMSVKVLP
jgi:hypothetical protein